MLEALFVRIFLQHLHVKPSPSGSPPKASIEGNVLARGEFS